MNYSDYRKSDDLEEIRTLIRTTCLDGSKIGHTSSPIWLEGKEMAEICRKLKIVCVELHSACPSNRYRSNIQIVLPSPKHKISVDDKVFKLLFYKDILITLIRKY